MSTSKDMRECANVKICECENGKEWRTDNYHIRTFTHFHIGNYPFSRFNSPMSIDWMFR